MKKIHIFLVTILAGMSLKIDAYQPHLFDFKVYVPICESGLSVGITGLYLRPSVPHLDYALSYPTTPPTDSAEKIGGVFESVDPRYDWGYKVCASYLFPCTGVDVLLAYTNFDHESTNSVLSSAPFGLFSTFFFGSPNDLGITDFFITFPSGLIRVVTVPGPIIEANMTARFDYQAWDAELAQHMNVGKHFKIRWFGGLRYVDLDQKLHAVYRTGINSTTVPGDLIGSDIRVDVDTTFTANQRSQFRGIGPRFGTNISFPFSRYFSLVAEGSAALLVGENDSSYSDLFRHIITATFVVAGTDTVIPGSEGLVITDDSIFSYRHPDEIRVVPNLEGKVGINYAYTFCNASRTTLSIEAGWMATHYYNSFDRLSAADTVEPEFRTRKIIDTSFDGPYVGIALKF